MTLPPSTPTPRLVAVKTLVLDNGTELHDQVLQLDDVGKIIAYHPLTAELPFCIWKRSTVHQHDTISTL